MPIHDRLIPRRRDWLRGLAALGGVVLVVLSLPSCATGLGALSVADNLAAGEACLAASDWKCANEHGAAAGRAASRSKDDKASLSRARALVVESACGARDPRLVKEHWFFLTVEERRGVMAWCDEAGRHDFLLDGILATAQDSYVHQVYSDAVEGAWDAIHYAALGDARLLKAWRLLGSSACFNRDEATARTAWSHLGTIDLQFLRFVCRRNGIEMPPG